MSKEDKLKHEGNKTLCGRLYLCATPIGNMEDITIRVLRTLREADYIAAEDTRRTRKILSKYNIKNKLISYHQHNQKDKEKIIIDSILEGNNVALTSDAGTPGISDPGALLAEAAIHAGITVEALPGAAAFLIALLVSGLNTDRFIFEGFLPRKKRNRDQILSQLSVQDRTIILYEAPHRIRKLLDEIYEKMGDRRISLCRELTKKFEDVTRGTVSEMIEKVEINPPRGEYTIVIEGMNGTETDEKPTVRDDDDLESVLNLLKEYISGGMSKKDAVQEVAKSTGIKKRDIYQISLKL